MEKQFTCAVSMAVTEEQFNNDLRQPLIDLGYDASKLESFLTGNKLVNNAYNNFGRLGIFFIEDNERHFIDTYNPKLFLALASLTTESTETKEEILARFEKGVEERELIGYRFRNDKYNRMTIKYFSGSHIYGLRANNTHISDGSDAVKLLTELNLLDTFCEPVYKEATISIKEAETILRSIGRNAKIKA